MGDDQPAVPDVDRLARSMLQLHGDHHDHDGKKCKKNEDNNCNDTENNQKLTPKEDCDNETTIKDHSKKNDNGNVLVCSTDAVNLKDSVLLNSTIFGDTIEPIF